MDNSTDLDFLILSSSTYIISYKLFIQSEMNYYKHLKFHSKFTGTHNLRGNWQTSKWQEIVFWGSLFKLQP